MRTSLSAHVHPACRAGLTVRRPWRRLPHRLGPPRQPPHRHTCQQAYSAGSVDTAPEEKQRKSIDSEESEQISALDEEDGSDPVSATMDMLGWDELCTHVAGFASTSLGKERVKKLEVPSTEAESIRLQKETQAAYSLMYEAGLSMDLGGISSEPVVQGLSRANKGGLVGPDHLLAISRMLSIADAVKRLIVQSDRKDMWGSKFPERVKPLLSVWRSLKVNRDLKRMIEDAVDEQGALKDNASSDLRDFRTRYRTVKNRLEQVLRGYGGEVTERGGRLCLGLPSDANVPPGALMLGSSLKQGIVYVEPQAALEHNNRLAAAYGEMKAAEEAVLWDLTSHCVDAADDLRLTFETVIDLDVVIARASYTNWIKGNFPEFVPIPEPQPFKEKGRYGFYKPPEENYLVYLEGLIHPLLLGHSLFQKDAAIRKARLKNFGKKKKKAVVVDEPEGPVPIDILLKKETRAVVITGPNTGGKTAALKALGLTVLMAKAGLGVPASQPARLPCYSAVLADIGDEQSLTASLSTFSGHLKRIQALRDVADGDCLVLLDELGTGTDPEEGAALGVALVKRLIRRGLGGALTSFVTTHHGLLTTLAYDENIPPIENASVEFDEYKMAPTYRLMMGVPGKSNALVIASRLGLDPEIVQEATDKVGKRQESINSTIQELQEAQYMSTIGTSRTKEYLEKVSDVSQEAAVLRGRVSALERQIALKEQAIYPPILSKARKRLSNMVKSQQKKREPEVPPPEPLKRKDRGLLERKLQRKQRVVKSVPKKKKPEKSDWVPSVGESVLVKKLNKVGTVVEVGPGNKVAVQAGFFSMNVDLSDVTPAE
ncbi:hypothetical protein BSKO_00236 [Bryopsis sp. KO-2023]|nr:hypothetical protein BSKO_00236 [Bryopsis sp. KO-2023]